MPLHRELDLLARGVKDRARKAIELMNADPILKSFGVDKVVVNETLRDMAVQMAYFSRGRMPNTGDVQAMYKAAGLYPLSPAEAIKKITWTLDSKHIMGKAVDIAPSKGGVVWWAAPEGAWTRMGEIGESCGLTWGGRWKNKDNPHFEVV